MGAVYRLTVRQLAGGFRLLIMAGLALGPVCFTMLVLSSGGSPRVDQFEEVVVNSMLAGAILPLIVLACGAAAFSNELEDKTLANLTLAPIARWKIVVPKLLATLTVAAPFVVLSTLAVSWLAYLGDGRAVFAVTFAALLGVLLYSAFFLWLGLKSTQAIGIGLLYVVVWEGFFTGLVSGARVLSIRHYAASLMHGFDPRRFATDQMMSFTGAGAVAVVVFGGFLWLSIRRLNKMDVP